jgi:cytochrome c-type biogenesis protein
MEAPGLFVSFIAGIVLFASPCVAPIIPAYLASIAGVNLSRLQTDVQRDLQRRIFQNALAFVLGFSAVFILIGTFMGALSSLTPGFQIWLNRIGGALIIILSLHLLRLIQIPFLERGASLRSQLRDALPPGHLRSATMGLAFGVGFSPCTGPVLGAILAYTATSGSTLHGAMLMTSFSAGLALPFLLTGLFTLGVARWLGSVPRLLQGIQLTGGVMLLALGVIVFTGRLPGLIGILYSWF